MITANMRTGSVEEIAEEPQDEDTPPWEEDTEE